LNLWKTWEVYINIDPNIRFGKPCIAGTRITVQDILEWLASGMSFEEIVEDFPELDVLKIRAALAFASPNNLQALLLSGPVWTEEEYQHVLQAREKINQLVKNGPN